MVAAAKLVTAESVAAPSIKTHCLPASSLASRWPVPRTPTAARSNPLQPKMQLITFGIITLSYSCRPHHRHDSLGENRYPFLQRLAGGKLTTTFFMWDG